jgi:hypothetical protein
MSLKKWSIEEGWILCKMDGLQCAINCPQFKRGTTARSRLLLPQTAYVSYDVVDLLIRKFSLEG